MQLKIITRTNTYRFNQQGQAITQITEPYVHVEVYTREDVVALFDQREEHLVNAFQYEGEDIVGTSEKIAESVATFFQAEGAWYLQQLHEAQEDNSPGKAPPEENTCGENNGTCAGDVAGAVAPEASDDQGLITDPNQQKMLRQIQTLAERLRRIKPDPADSWDRQVQKLLLSQQHFGIQDAAQAHEQGQGQLDALVGEAKAAGIPASVIETNLTVSTDDIPEADEDDEEEKI